MGITPLQANTLLSRNNFLKQRKGKFFLCLARRKKNSQSKQHWYIT